MVDRGAGSQHKCYRAVDNWICCSDLDDASIEVNSNGFCLQVLGTSKGIPSTNSLVGRGCGLGFSSSELLSIIKV